MTEREKALEATLHEIARQKKTDEMSREERYNGDFEGAYDTCIDTARHALAALAMPATVDRASWEAGRDAAAATAYRICAETRHVTLGQNCHDAIRSLTPPEDAP